MTLDVEQIRQALAAATPLLDNGEERPTNEYRLARSFVNRYAPVWLASLCDEIERLRAIVAVRIAEHQGIVAARDAALAECEQLRHECLLRDTTTGELKECEADLAVALAECERLRKLGRYDRDRRVRMSVERDAWRACADRLAHDLQEALDYVGQEFISSLDEHKRLSDTQLSVDKQPDRA